MLLGSSVDRPAQVAAVLDSGYLASFMFPSVVLVPSSGGAVVGKYKALCRGDLGTHVLQKLVSGINAILHKLAVVYTMGKNEQVVSENARLGS